jgi:hypothetical protein
MAWKRFNADLGYEVLLGIRRHRNPVCRWIGTFAGEDAR